MLLSRSSHNTENEVDTCALLQLIGDLDEFKLLVPQAGVRLKIKAIVKKV